MIIIFVSLPFFAQTNEDRIVFNALGSNDVNDGKPKKITSTVVWAEKKLKLSTPSLELSTEFQILSSEVINNKKFGAQVVKHCLDENNLYVKFTFTNMSSLGWGIEMDTKYTVNGITELLSYYENWEP